MVSSRQKKPRAPIFLYGTLRPGGSHGYLVTPYLVEQSPARTWGRLYHAPAGYPALDVPEAACLATGTLDPARDAATAASHRPTSLTSSQNGDWGWVYGELVWIIRLAECMPALDQYEGFCPGGRSLYKRVLISVACLGTAQVAWTYVKKPAPRDRRLPGGIWPPK